MSPQPGVIDVVLRAAVMESVVNSAVCSAPSCLELVGKSVSPHCRIGACLVICRCAVVGVPKTIDNDITLVDRSAVVLHAGASFLDFAILRREDRTFGFDTACTEAAAPFGTVPPCASLVSIDKKGIGCQCHLRRLAKQSILLILKRPPMQTALAW